MFYTNNIGQGTVVLPYYKIQMYMKHPTISLLKKTILDIIWTAFQVLRGEQAVVEVLA